MDATAVARVPFWTMLPGPALSWGVRRGAGLAGGGAAGADRLPGSSRGDRVHLANARLAGCADREQRAAERLNNTPQRVQAKHRRIAGQC